MNEFSCGCFQSYPWFSLVHALIIAASLAFSLATSTQPPETPETVGLSEELTDSFVCTLLFSDHKKWTWSFARDGLQNGSFPNLQVSLLSHWSLSRDMHFCSTWHLLAAQILLAKHTRWHWHGHWHRKYLCLLHGVVMTWALCFCARVNREWGWAADAAVWICPKPSFPVDASRSISVKVLSCSYWEQTFFKLFFSV